jgi:hypothetical protein
LRWAGLLTRARYIHANGVVCSPLRAAR